MYVLLNFMSIKIIQTSWPELLHHPIKWFIWPWDSMKFSFLILRVEHLSAYKLNLSGCTWKQDASSESATLAVKTYSFHKAQSPFLTLHNSTLPLLIIGGVTIWPRVWDIISWFDWSLNWIIRIRFLTLKCANGRMWWQFRGICQHLFWGAGWCFQFHLVKNELSNVNASWLLRHTLSSLTGEGPSWRTFCSSRHFYVFSSHTFA